MTEKQLIIPNYKEIILHIKKMIDFPTDFTLVAKNDESKVMNVIVSPNEKETELIAIINYSEKFRAFDLEIIYKRVGMCMDKAERIVDGIDNVDFKKRFLILGLVHEFGHIYRMSLAYKYKTHRTFIASRSMNAKMHVSIDRDKYLNMRYAGYDPMYLLSPEEMYADSFTKDYYDIVIDSLIRNNLI